MDENQRQKRDNLISKMIEEELAHHSDLLPPWRKYPDIHFGSIGWRMGYGESYMIAWHKWANEMSQEQLVGYFKTYAPIPVEWLLWVSTNCFDDENISQEIFLGDGSFNGIRWLEQQGLAKFSEFKLWYETNWKKKE